MVTQLQYTAWPDHDVPRSATPLIELNKTLRAVQGNRKKQLLVHCRYCQKNILLVINN